MANERFNMLTLAARFAPRDGLVLEFGVASGTTIRFLAEALPHRRIYGFDWFKGLPEPWGPYRIGHFACEPPVVPDNVELVVGLFTDTLPSFLREHVGACALIHLDADLYVSTRSVLELLNSRIVPGTIIAMDEFHIYTDHEQRAFNDWCAHHERRTHMLGYRVHSEQAVMRVMT